MTETFGNSDRRFKSLAIPFSRERKAESIPERRMSCRVIRQEKHKHQRGQVVGLGGGDLV